jgi:hypothetical protein
VASKLRSQRAQAKSPLPLTPLLKLQPFQFLRRKKPNFAIFCRDQQLYFEKTNNIPLVNLRHVFTQFQGLDEQVLQKPRICWTFETLQAHLAQERRRKVHADEWMRCRCWEVPPQNEGDILIIHELSRMRIDMNILCIYNIYIWIIIYIIFMNRLYCNIYRGSQIDGPGKSWFICHQYGKNSSQNETFLCDSAIPIGAGTLSWQTGATHLFVCHQKKIDIRSKCHLVWRSEDAIYSWSGIYKQTYYLP